MSIYQDLAQTHGFTHAYNSVKRFVATLTRRAPERLDVLEFLPGWLSFASACSPRDRVRSPG